MPLLRPVPKLEVELMVIINLWALGVLWREQATALIRCGKCPACIGSMLQCLKITKGANGGMSEAKA